SENPSATANPLLNSAARGTSLGQFTASWIGSASLARVIFPPLSERHRRTFAGSRLNLHLIHEPLGAGKPHPHAASRGIAFPHRRRDVRDARAAIGKYHFEADPAGLFEPLPQHRSFAGVTKNIAGEFGGSGDDTRDVRLPKAKSGGHVADG